MADNDRPKPAIPAKGSIAGSWTTGTGEVVAGEQDRKAFRRQAALGILQAFVMRHGGFAEAEREMILRQVWTYATEFVALEDAPPLPVPTPPEPEQVRPRGRAAHPSDEWAVIDGDHMRRGFVSEQEAEYYASVRPGARIKQVSGPGVATAPATA